VNAVEVVVAAGAVGRLEEDTVFKIEKVLGSEAKFTVFRRNKMVSKLMGDKSGDTRGLVTFS